MKLVNLIPLKEIDFRNQDQFDDYQQQHSLRPDTKVTIAGKPQTVAQASKNSEPVKGSSVFGKDKGVSVFGKTGGASTKSDKVASKPDGMATVNAIAAGTGLRAQAVAGWADENGVNLSKVAADLKSKKLKPMDMMTAVTGNPGNKYAKDIIAKYSQSGTSASKPSVKSKPFDADRDSDDFEKALPKGFSWYGGGTIDGVTAFGDDDGNNVFVSDPSVYDDEGNYAVSGYNDEGDITDTNYKSFKDKQQAIEYAKQLAIKLSGSTNLSEMLPKNIKY
jgi:hypothetical protein